MPRRWLDLVCRRRDSGPQTESWRQRHVRPPQRTGSFWLNLPLFLLGAWIFLSRRRHLIFVASNCSLVMLSKAPGTAGGTYIGEPDWGAFAARYPALLARLMAGEGMWILGSLR